jgi:hypothetical protein
VPTKKGTSRSAAGDVAAVVTVSTNVGTRCKHCSESIGLERFAESVTHYIEKHGYQLLHVGSETSLDHEGKPWHSTVAVLGAKPAKGKASAFTHSL